MTGAIALAFLILFIFASISDNDQPSRRTTQPAPRKNTVSIVAETTINVRQSPDSDSDVLFRIDKGETVDKYPDRPVEADGFTWIKVEWRGANGWAARRFFSAKRAGSRSARVNRRASEPSSSRSSSGTYSPAQNLAIIDDQSPNADVVNVYDRLLERAAARCEGVSKSKVSDWIAFSWTELRSANHGHPYTSCLDLLNGFVNATPDVTSEERCRENVAAILLILQAEM